MSSETQLIMPSSFRFEAPNGAALNRLDSGGLFQPCGASAYLGVTSSGSPDPAVFSPNAKRKRMGNAESAMMTKAAASTKPGLEHAYVLAGQIDSPDNRVRRDLIQGMEDSIYSDMDDRRALGPKHSHKVEYDSSIIQNPQLTSQHGSWGATAFSTIGGVVGKVWQFCKAGAFRGFYAGGGQGFEIDGSDPIHSSSFSTNKVWCNEHDVATLPDDEYGPIPGGFPQSDFAPFYYETETPESTPPRAAKRRQISGSVPGEELRKNWVMVNDNAESTNSRSFTPRSSTARTPHRSSAIANRRINKPVPRLSTTPSYARSQSRAGSHAGSASLSNREPASFASSRSPTPSGFHSPSRIPVLSRAETSRPSSPSCPPHQPPRCSTPTEGSRHRPGRGHRRNQSAASAASFSSVTNTPTRRGTLHGGETGRHSSFKKRESTGGGGSLASVSQEGGSQKQSQSPRLSREAQSLAAKRRKEEMENDMRIDDFTAQLRDLIRQGKEALGTTVEIEEDDDEDMGIGGGGVPGGDVWEDA